MGGTLVMSAAREDMYALDWIPRCVPDQEPECLVCERAAAEQQANAECLHVRQGIGYTFQLES